MKNRYEEILKNIGVLIAIGCGVATYLMWVVALLRAN